MDIENIINTESYPLADQGFRSSCRETLNRTGVIIMHRFLNPVIVEAIRREGIWE